MAYAAFSVVFGEQPSAAKWNILGSNDASFNDGTGIADGTIKPNHLVTSSSTANTWAWDTYTPTLANTTLGNGTVVGKYIKIGRFVQFYASFRLGTTSAVGTAPTVTLPVTASATAFDAGSGSVRIGISSFEDNAISSHEGFTLIAATTASATVAVPIVITTGGTYASTSAITALIPFTWGTSDVLRITGSYESA